MGHYVEKMTSDKKEMEVILATKYQKRLDPKSEEVKAASQEPQNPVDAALQKINNMKWVVLSKYGWDQTDKKVKIYITSGIDGIQDIP